MSWHWPKLTLKNILTIGCIVLLIELIISDTAMESQVWFSISLVLGGYLLWLFRGIEPIRITLLVLATVAFSRYIWWRGTHTLNLSNLGAGTISLVVFAAEFYALIAFGLNFFQVLRFDRSPNFVEPDPEYTPSVDIFIPSYNESVDILTRTICGAQGIKYLNKTVYLLDDSRRPEMKKLSVRLGCKYITRADNQHAKAGNLNNALSQTNGEFILIFDADHIPVGSFLERTIHFFKDERVALVQTAHRFVNPGPIERNLYLEGKLPNEQELFFQRVQIGNNHWNSSFFCGSAAILRRSALKEIGGIATGTITEDFHTSLKLHGAGWKSIYVSTPLSAGLSPETFRAHIIQRCRWAQGGVQIFRLDNPLFYTGLSWPQKICYFSALTYFLFGMPRLVFLTVPLTFALLGWQPFLADAFSVMVMGAPYFILIVLAANYYNRNIRHSFWSEIYESLIAVYMTYITTLALLFPHKAKFQVTPKGSTTTVHSYRIVDAWSLLIFLFFYIVALATAPWRFSQCHGLPEQQGLIINSFWLFGNFIIILTGTLVAIDRPYAGRAHRVQKELPVTMTCLDSPEVFSGQTVNINEFDTLIALANPLEGNKYFLGQKVDVAFNRAHQKGAEFKVEGIIRRIKKVKNKIAFLALEFVNVSADKQISLIHLSYSDQHTWNEFREPPDSILYSYWNLLTSPVRVFWRTLLYYTKLPGAGLRE